MGSGYRTFTAGEVLTASNVQDYLMDQSVMVFADSTARETAIGTANFEEGMTSYLQDTNLVEVYNGTTWASIAPAAVTPGLVQIGTAISFSGVSSQSINDVFSATYNNYLITLNNFQLTTDNTNVLFRVRVSGTDNTSSNYVRGAVFVGVGTGQALSSTNAQTNNFSLAGQYKNNYQQSARIEISDPFATANTSILTRAVGALLTIEHILLNVSTSYTGFSLIADAGNMSGTVRVYGLAN